MKKSNRWIIYTFLAVVAFVLVFQLYNSLKDDYAYDRLTDASQAIQQEAADNAGSDEASSSDSGEDSQSTKKYPAPNFTVLDADGNEVQFNDYIGKPIVLNFWASWCYYCKVEMPDFNAAYLNHPEVQFMMVNVTDGSSETIESANEYLAAQDFEFPIFYDTQLQAAMTYGASGLPMTIFIDAEGNLITYAPGMLTADELEQGIAMAKQGIQ